MAFNEHDRKRQELNTKLLFRLLHEEEKTDEWIEEIERLTEINQVLIKELAEKNKPVFALTTFFNNQKYIIMADVSLVIGSPKDGLFTLIDNKTLLPISPVSYSNQALGANSNPSAATATLDASLNKVTITPVAPGSGSLVITTDASYTDPGDGSTQSGSFTVTKNFTVVPSADGASFDVVFP